MTHYPVIGRFAPSPTGSLHFGSLVSAVGSYLEAKCAAGRWVIRVEDIDPPREVAGSSKEIINDLRRFGMHEDGPILFQSSRTQAYQAAVKQLLAQDLAYPCACSRKDLPASGIYPGTCRNGIAKGKAARAIRFKVPLGTCQFTDALQGVISESVAATCGDFIIQRADGLFAYQLAVVIDDDFQGVTEVVRGADLLDSTCRQICLQKALQIKQPQYMHLPLAVADDGKKLSKRDMTDPIRQQDYTFAVRQALRFLGQTPPANLALEALWTWALEHWDRKKIPPQKKIKLSKV